MEAAIPPEVDDDGETSSQGFWRQNMATGGAGSRNGLGETHGERERRASETTRSRFRQNMSKPCNLLRVLLGC